MPAWRDTRVGGAALFTLDLDCDGGQRRLEPLLRLCPHRRQLVLTPLVRNPSIEEQRGPVGVALDDIESVRGE